jgi:hypothetical protein
MAKGTVMDEVSILKFFETGPIEKAETLYNIIAEKMRERVSARAQDGGESAMRGSIRKRQARTNPEAPREEGTSSLTA